MAWLHTLHFLLTPPVIEKWRHVVLFLARACWVWLAALGPEQLEVWRGLAGIAGNVAESRDGFLAPRPDHGVEVGLQGVEGGDEHVDVVDTNAHLGGQVVDMSGGV